MMADSATYEVVIPKGKGEITRCGGSSRETALQMAQGEANARRQTVLIRNQITRQTEGVHPSKP